MQLPDGAATPGDASTDDELCRSRSRVLLASLQPNKREPGFSTTLMDDFSHFIVT